MDISMESLHTQGDKRGALLRRRTPTELRTLRIYRGDNDIRRSEHLVEHGGDVRGWTRWTRSDESGTVTAQRTAPGTLEVDGQVVQVPDDTVPSEAAILILLEMLAGSHTEAEFHEQSETDPVAQPRAAHFSVGNPETVDLPGSGPRELGTVVLYRDDEPGLTFWFDSDAVVLSEWGDTTTRHVDSIEELLDGLDDEVAAQVREFVSTR